jgi:citrate synthase
MKRSVPREEIVSTIAEALGCEASALGDDTGHRRHPKWDSLGHLRVMLALERKYGVVLDESTMNLCTSIRSIVNHIVSNGTRQNNDATK